jgi:PKD repeat protein
VVSVSPSVEGSAAVLTGSFTDANAGDAHTVTIDWGDGSATTDLALDAGTTSFNASHAFAGVGWYTVNVTVSDAASARVSGSADANVVARNHAPTGLALSVSSSVEGDTATLSGTFNDLDAGDAHTVVVSWGDGSATSQIALAAGLGSVSATHAYASAGSYTVNATVSDDAGLSASASATATVTAKPIAPATLDSLRAMINSWTVDAGTRNSLLTKVKDSCSSLSALANEASALLGKKLTATQVSTFNALLAQVSTTVGCSGTATPTVKNATPTAKGSVTRR